MARKKISVAPTRTKNMELDALIKSVPGRNPALLLDKIGVLVELADGRKTRKRLKRHWSGVPLPKEKNSMAYSAACSTTTLANAWISRHHEKKTATRRQSTHWEQLKSNSRFPPAKSRE